MESIQNPVQEKKARAAEPVLPSHTIPHSVAHPTPSRSRSLARRLIRVLATVALIWYASRLLSGPVAYLDFPESNQSNILLVPLDVETGQCAKWPYDAQHDNAHISPLNYYRSSSYTFKLPISSTRFSLLSRGSAVGILEITQSDEVADFAKVSVVATYHVPNSLDQTKVCAFKQGEGENGVGIFVAEWPGRPPHDHNDLHFKVVVQFPRSSGGPPLHINRFDTDMQLFAHEVGDLAGNVDFNSISLKTANMPVNAKSLAAGKAIVETSNGPIEGNFNVSSSLVLVTSNAHIKTQVSLWNNDVGETTTLVMRTNNAMLESSVSLLSGKEMGGKFNVTAVTALGSLSLSFPTAPFGSSLRLAAYTALSPATVQLHETYEGTFHLVSSFFRPTISFDEDIEDPTGKGRKRSVEVNVLGPSYVDGSASWSNEGKSLGSVDVKTSLASLEFKL